MSNTLQKLKEQLEKEFERYGFILSGKNGDTIKSFLSSSIDLAYEEGRKEDQPKPKIEKLSIPTLEMTCGCGNRFVIYEKDGKLYSSNVLKVPKPKIEKLEEVSAERDGDKFLSIKGPNMNDIIYKINEIIETINSQNK